ncbi:hypothetical protein C8Q80DRAFT_1118259 [Daedaleopsis nitida]|nr:hypothetical protein C8Q80DRAFT_1118259 [Daedaleopsis nitida]
MDDTSRQRCNVNLSPWKHILIPERREHQVFFLHRLYSQDLAIDFTFMMFDVVVECSIIGTHSALSNHAVQHSLAPLTSSALQVQDGDTKATRLLRRLTSSHMRSLTITLASPVTSLSRSTKRSQTLETSTSRNLRCIGLKKEEPEDEVELQINETQDDSSSDDQVSNNDADANANHDKVDADTTTPDANGEGQHRDSPDVRHGKEQSGTPIANGQDESCDVFLANEQHIPLQTNVQDTAVLDLALRSSFSEDQMDVDQASLHTSIIVTSPTMLNRPTSFAFDWRKLKLCLPSSLKTSSFPPDYIELLQKIWFKSCVYCRSTQDACV